MINYKGVSNDKVDTDIGVTKVKHPIVESNRSKMQRKKKILFYFGLGVVAVVFLRTLIGAYQRSRHASERNNIVDAKAAEERLDALGWKTTNGITLRPWLLGNSIEFYFMTFLVSSTIEATKRRKDIRDTWGGITDINGKRFGVMFLVGRSNDHVTQKALERENALYGDILQSPISDEDSESREKALAAYEWIYHEWSDRSDFYALTADDSIVNLAKVFDYFTMNQIDFMSEKVLYCDKFAESEEIRKEKSSSEDLLAFCGGRLSVLSFPLLAEITKSTAASNQFPCNLFCLAPFFLRSNSHLVPVKFKRIDNKQAVRFFRYNIGPFSWRIADNNFSIEWTLLFNMMTLTVRNETHSGYWPCAKGLFATGSSSVNIPNVENVKSLFEKHFGPRPDVEKVGE